MHDAMNAPGGCPNDSYVFDKRYGASVDACGGWREARWVGLDENVGRWSILMISGLRVEGCSDVKRLFTDCFVQGRVLERHYPLCKVSLSFSN
jgi:hypothetical protein